MKKDTKKETTRELKKRIEELEGQLKRALADYQNLEKRVAQERHEWIRNANKELLLRILPILDTLILASKQIDDEGLKVGTKQFIDVLKSEGVEKIEVEGRDFDPRVMECVDTIVGSENKVLEEVRVGFTLSDQVLRPAQVKVGRE